LRVSYRNLGSQGPIDQIVHDLHHISDSDAVMDTLRAVFEGIADEFGTLAPAIRWHVFQNVHLPLLYKVVHGYQSITEHIKSSFYPINSDGKFQDLDRLIYASNVMYNINETLQQWSLELFYVEFFEVANANDLLHGVWEELIHDIEKSLGEGMRLLAQEYLILLQLPLNRYYKK
jgi:hypothetical protein